MRVYVYDVRAGTLLAKYTHISRYHPSICWQWLSSSPFLITVNSLKLFNSDELEAGRKALGLGTFIILST